MSAADILAQPLCALAFCWRLERRDGIAIGLTSHDRPLMIDRFRYRPAPGIRPSAIRRDGSGAGEALEIEGALAAGAISTGDLEAGRWDGAALAIHLTEWTAPGALWLELARGTLGTVEMRDGAYQVSVASGFAMLDRPVAPETSPTCRVALGDAACTVDLRPLTSIATVTGVEGERVNIAGADAGDEYAFGTLRWLDGPLAGITHAIVAEDGGALILAERPLRAIPPGTRARLVHGCDRRLASCAGRFANAANFRGEAFLPGMDLLTRYPGA